MLLLFLVALSPMPSPAPLTLYNSLSRSVEDFTPAQSPAVSLYVCGPTVYDLAHLGHARCYITWDVLVRTLTLLGYQVTYARNVTDVDDKIINKAVATGQSPQAVATHFLGTFEEDMAALNVAPPTLQPKATEHIGDMHRMIETLIAKDFAYQTAEGSVYFATQAMPTYGALSRKPPEALQAGARVAVDGDKRDSADFALWKRCPQEETGWDSPWGWGRPGWHIECSSMVNALFGPEIDIHAGGADLLFPHHENEIAQSECCHGATPYVRYWLHNGFVNVDGEKMSKSLGNFASVRDLLQHLGANALRYFLLSHHYRMPVDFTPDALEGAKNGMARLQKRLQQALEGLHLPQGAKTLFTPLPLASLQAGAPAFVEALQQDMNTAQALGAFNTYLKQWLAEDSVSSASLQLALSCLGVLGFDLDALLSADKGAGALAPSEAQKASTQSALQALAATHNLPLPQGATVEDTVEAVLQARQQAKADKQWALADALRDGLAAASVLVEDRPQNAYAWSWQTP